MTTEELIQHIQNSLASYPKGRVFNSFRLADYLGTPREVYKIPTPEVRRIARTLLKNQQDLAKETWLNLLDQMYMGPTYTDRQIASNLLGLHHQLRQSFDLDYLDRWLTDLAGWCEIDNLCQSNFSAAEMLARWPKWRQLLTRLVHSKNISKRRASLVLLTRSVRESDDKRLATIAFNQIKQLENEQDILITKAISWLLRELISYHRPLVETYLEAHRETLPKIAIREVSRKLATGKK